MASPFAELPPVIDNVRVASPCTANWEEMAGDERVRFCSQCRLHVYNLSAMSRHDAQQLLMQRGKHLCVRFYRRADGTVLTRDCPVGLRALRRRFWRGVVLAMATFVSLSAGLSYAWSTWKSKWLASTPEPVPWTCRPDPVLMSADPPPMMGKVVAPPSGKEGWAMGGAPAR